MENRIGNDRRRRNELDTLLNTMLRTLEHLCISYKRGVIDEEIFKDYILDIILKTCRNTYAFIRQQWAIRDSAQVFINFVDRATDWDRRLNLHEIEDIGDYDEHILKTSK